MSGIASVPMTMTHVDGLTVLDDGRTPVLTSTTVLADRVQVAVDVAAPTRWHRVTIDGSVDELSASTSAGVLDATVGDDWRTWLAGAAPSQVLVDLRDAAPLLRVAFLDALYRWLDRPLDDVLLLVERAAARGAAAASTDVSAAGGLVTDGWNLVVDAVSRGALERVPRWVDLTGRSAVTEAVATGLNVLAAALPHDDGHPARALSTCLSAALAATTAQPDLTADLVALAAGTAPPRTSAGGYRSRIDPALVPARVLRLGGPADLGEIRWWEHGDGVTHIDVPASSWLSSADEVTERLVAELHSSAGVEGGCVLTLAPDRGSFVGRVPVAGPNMTAVVVSDVLLAPMTSAPVTQAEPAVLATRKSVRRLRTLRQAVLLSGTGHGDLRQDAVDAGTLAEILP